MYKKTAYMSEVEENRQILEEAFPSKRIFKLSRSVTIADKTYTELDIDFDSLSNKDKNDLRRIQGCGTQIVEGFEIPNTLYLQHIISRAANISFREFEALSMGDGESLVSWARGFFLKKAAIGVIQET